MSCLIEQVVKGEPFIIAKAGKPLVMVVPLDAGNGARCPRTGSLAGEIAVPDDFDQMGRDRIEEMFEGKA